jgi:hypothetical protein
MSVSDDTKQEKRAVRYGPGMPKSHCAICTHYQSGSCSLVKGTISPKAWCRLFARKTGAKSAFPGAR